MHHSFNARVRTWSRSVLGRLFIGFCLFSYNTAYVLAATPTSPRVQSVHDTSFPEEGTSVSSMSLTSSDLGWTGPFSFGAGYGTLNQFSFNAQYTKKVNDYFAFSGLLEYGPQTYRFGGTLGFKILENDLLKFSAERFNQLLPFSFSSGNIEERMSQNAVGGRYHHPLANNYFKQIDMGAYYANAPNQSLDPVIFSVNDVSMINYRNIAGATSAGVDASTELQLSKSTGISAQLYYDKVQYNTKLTKNSSYDAQGIGGGLGIKQLFYDRIAVSAIGSLRKLYNTYTLGISWLPGVLLGSEVSLLGQRIITHNETPNSTILGLQFGYNFGMGGGGARYALAALDTTNDVGAWTATPAVYMEQVLAVSDETTEFYTGTKSMKSLSESAESTASISPISGPVEGGTAVVITGDDLSDVTAIKFGSTDVTDFTLNSQTQITAVTPSGIAGIVEVAIVKSLEKSITPIDQFTYQEAPAVMAISPRVGPESGDTVVTIDGKNFTGATAVEFNGVAATSFDVVKSSQIIVRAPAGTAGSSVDITVSTPSGKSAILPDNQFTYEALHVDDAAPTVTNLAPNSAPLAGGTTVVITGTNFTGATAVKFGTQPATNFTVNSATQIVAVTPAGTGVVNVTVTSPSGTSAAATANQLTYQDVPTVTSIAPNTGLPTGATSVVITGTNFTGATSVKFGTQNATSYTINSATKITAVSPAGTSGDVVDITVTTSSGTSMVSPADQFTYQTKPTVTALSPISGPLAGGTVVVITGSNFIGTTAVKFGTVNATNFIVNSATQITALSPGGTGGVNITVTTPVGTSVTSSATLFTYQGIPTVTSLSPIAGPVTGGTTVVITGTNFIGTSAVNFGAQNAASFTVNSATQISAVTPPGTGAVNATVTTPSGTSVTSVVNQFTYQDVPTITSISPSAGLPAGGTVVTINGTNLLGTTAVLFGSKAGTSVTVVSPTQLTVKSPAGTTGSTVDITVTTGSGTSITSPADQFTYESVPTITGITPNTGVLNGGTTVVITGTNFLQTQGVSFGSTFATTYTVDSSTQITAVAPTNVGGVVNVRVTTPVGTSVIGTAAQYTYQDAPTLSSISPTAGLPAGSTSVVITGVNFLNATAVNFGGQPAKSFKVNSATQITAVSPAGTQGNAVDITVTTPVGITPVVPTGQYIYEGAPTITKITPNAGALAGGTSVVITGTNFINTLGVSFGSVFATSYTIDSPTQITAVAPANVAGLVNVRVTTPVGTSAIATAAQYVYENGPTITTVSPNAGLPAGSTSVVITGVNFLNATAVNFGGQPAKSFTVNSATQITAVSPAGTQGNAVDIRVTTPVGITPVVPTGQFIYEGAPTITKITPNTGVLAGGTSVVITGTNFINTLGVSFGSVFATSYTIDSPTQITAVAPANVAGVANVRVTTPVGTSVIATAAQYTYQNAPTITTVSPNAGLPAGSTSVVITGVNFLNATAVNFGGLAAKSFTVNSATQITAVSPAGTQGNAVDITVTTPVGITPVVPTGQFVYEGVPTITKITPNAGVLAGGATVVITGTNFINTLGVSFGSVFATSYTIDSPTQITAVAPANVGGVANVRVTTPVGTSVIATAAQYTYQDTPTISSVSPNAGLPVGNTTVVISGSNFTNAQAVNFGGLAAKSFTVNSATQITAVSPAGVQGNFVDITVTTPVGITPVSAADQFTYQGAPSIAGITPNTGVLAGGTSVVITGTNFINTLGVSFGSVFATSFTVDSPTQITVVAPTNVAGVANVRVTTPVGTSVIATAAQYTYQNAPTITGVSPNAGLPAGNTSVVISGSNFTNASAVNFGGQPAKSFIVNSATQITAVSPAGTQGNAVDITVTTPIGVTPVSSADQFIYQGVPTITGLTPSAGLPAGGATLVITGTNFINTLGVSFGSVFATSFTVDSPTQITAVAPANVVGVANVRVTTPVGTSVIAAAAQYSYQNAPTIASVFPSAGLPAGGTTVVIAGTNLINATAVNFGGQAATSFTVNSATRITAVSPAGVQGNTIEITVTTPAGTSPVSSTDQFTYEAVPIVLGVTPNVGDPAGGTTVVITGDNFIGATAVQFGGADVSNFVVNSATQITAVTSSGTGTVDATVTTPVGSSITSLASQFTYEGTPTVTSLSPTAGSLAGGTTVVLTGTNFIGATAVNFGSQTAKGFTVNSATQITAVTPAGMGSVNATVVTPIGTSGSSAANEFVFQGVPTVTSITPNAGLPVGGRTVVITGTNFVNTTAVNFGGQPATSFTVNSATQITAVSPPGVLGSSVNITVSTPVGTSLGSSADQFTYEGPPSITAITPNAGVPAGGTTVVITGTNFTNALAVNFGTAFATSFTVDSPTQITAVSPANIVGTVNVRVTSPVGTSAMVPVAQYVYEDIPTVTRVFPNAGLPIGGTTVVIKGTNFTNATAVNFGGQPATSFTVNSATQITAVSPTGTQSSTADITVTTPVGTSSVSSADEFTYEEPPVIMGISPNAGLPAGGTTVVITGVNFTDDLAVNFGTAFATSFTVDSSTQVTAISPPGVAGIVNVRVTTPVATSVLTPVAKYVYEDAPTVTRVFPNAGLPIGGTTVVIKGTNFTNATAVNFDGQPATSFTVNSATQITAVSPAGTQSSTADITVTTPVGTSPVSSADEFTYEEPPVIMGISPNAGLPAGGTTVVITGVNFTDDLAVNFGTAFATSFTVDSPTQVTAISPAGVAGIVNVRVTTPVATSVLTPVARYSYQNAPTVASVFPNAGLPVGGTTVVITGTNFTNATAVKFGGQSATSFTVNSATQMTAVSPTGTQSSTADITVTTPVGTSPVSSADEFTYEEPPVIMGISPNAGVPAGGTTVVITGVNFTDDLAVNFGPIFATSFTVDSPTQITAVAPANVAGIVNLRVTTPVATSVLTPVARYSYQNAPTVASVFPNAGLPVGGTTVVITGTNFTNATSVKFGGQPAISFTVNSATQITAVSPAGTQGSTADITVTTPVATSSISSSDQFTYEGVPNITGVTPNAGLPAGGTTVVITGTNFVNTLAVNFGPIFATSFTVDSPTQITAVSPASTTGITNVRVTTPVGTSVLTPAARYGYQKTPVVTRVFPNAGLPAGGTTVVITGSNFTNATGVQFGAQQAASFTVDDDTQITAVSPAGAKSSNAGITVVTPVGASPASPANQFVYQGPPSITGITPNAGLPAGGTSVVITGQNFTNALAVTFGPLFATSFTVDSPTQITALSPANVVGVANVRVTTSVATSAIAPVAQFSYEEVPTITNLFPNVGLPVGGTPVIITGANFSNVTAVSFGTTPATSFTIDSPTQISAVSPGGLQDSSVDISLTSLVGSSVSSPADQFTYEIAPVVTGISPNLGAPAGGGTIVITGAHFMGATSVNFGGTVATSFTVDSATQITAISPAGVPGSSVHITVTTPVGTSLATPADLFLYDPPVITSVVPSNGSPTGGTTVLINGIDFNSVLSVKFGSVDAASFTVISPSQISAVSPPGILGSKVDIQVTTIFGTSPVTVADKFLYADLASIAVTPATFSIGQGFSRQLTALGTYTDGSSRNLTSSVVWTSASPSVGSITTNGRVYGVSGGSSLITAKDLISGVFATASVNVVSLPTSSPSSLKANNSMMTPAAAAMKIRTPIVIVRERVATVGADEFALQCLRPQSYFDEQS